MSEGVYSTYELRVRAVEAWSRGLPAGEVADAYGVDRTTLYRWHKRYESHGEKGLIHSPGSGRPRTLKELNERELRAIVLKPASAFGYETDLWTVRRLHGVIRDRFEVDISRDTIWRRLREAGLTDQKPERQYYEIDEAARQEWLRTEVPKIRRTVRR